MYHVYILQSVGRCRFYIGCTTDCGKRLSEHNAGKTKSTKPFRPWRLIHQESYLNKGEAFKREWYLKHPQGYQEKMAIIRLYGEVA